MKPLPTVLIAVVVLAATTFITPPSATARTGGDPDSNKTERERVRARQEAVAGDIDVLEADQAQLEMALAELDRNVVAEEGLLVAAEQSAHGAERRADAAEREVARARSDLAELRDQIIEFAIQAYVSPHGSQIDSVFGSRNLNEVAQRKSLLDQRAESDAELTSRLRSTTEALEASQREADRARDEARSERAEAAERVGAVKAARQQQAAFRSEVSARIDDALGESIELAHRDKQLSYVIALDQAALEARLAEERAREIKASADALLALARQARLRDVADITGFAPAGKRGGIDLTTVDGITVNTHIARPLQAMLYTARSAGVVLTGGGYRDPAAQIAVRRANCGDNDYAIFEMPAAGCSPPTAPPGTSMHEVGVAIDFDACATRNTPCFLWLTANAERFGFYNLPSEPWHWSINGN